MSTSDLYSVYKTKAKHIAEFGNGHGTAPAIWGYLCKKHLNMESYAWLTAGSKLWDLSKDPRVSTHMRLVHAFTFNRALCPLDRLNELAEACEKVYTITYEDCPTHVNHWQSVANELRKIKPNKRSLGIGLSCTSIADHWLGWKGEEINKLWNIFEVLK